MYDRHSLELRAAAGGRNRSSYHAGRALVPRCTADTAKARSNSTVSDRTRRAPCDNATESRLRVLVVDDEALIRQQPGAAVSRRATMSRSRANANPATQAIAAIRDLRPDLVLLDVQMHDGTGLDVVERVGPEHMPAVVFVTAYDDYAVKAFELSAVDYLLEALRRRAG